MPALAARLGACLLGLILCPAIATAAEPDPLEIDITTHLGDRQTFVEGDYLSFFLSLERDAYIYLFYRDADGNLLQLLPNARTTGHFQTAGAFMPVPSAQQPFRFLVAPPFGDEILYAFASDAAGLGFPGTDLESGLRLLGTGIDQVQAGIKQASTTAFGRAELHLVTAPRE